MKIIIFVCFILIFYLPIQKKHVNSQQQGIDSDDGDAECKFFFIENIFSRNFQILQRFSTNLTPSTKVHWNRKYFVDIIQKIVQ